MSTLDTQQGNSAGAPATDLDLHTDELLTHPHEAFRQLRDMGPVVWLDAYGFYAFPRYAEVTAALGDWQTFTSTEGVGFNEYFNAIRETSLMTAGDHHDEIRRIEGQPMRPTVLRDLEANLRSYAATVAGDAIEAGTVDGVTAIAARLPLDVVTELVGLDDAGRDNLYTWGVAGFNSIGPLRAARTGPALETMGGYFAYAAEAIPARIRKGGWADQLFENGRKAGWSDEFCRGVMNDYVYPALDTTLNAISAGLLLFAQNPEEWQRLRADRSLLTSAVHEIIRLATPIQYFTRVVAADVEVGGLTLSEGSRVMLMFASANRDERQFPDPDRFDIGRSPDQHVGFGKGKHSCMGKSLARLELYTLFDVFADRVARFEVGDYAYEANNCIRGLGHMELTLIPG